MVSRVPPLNLALISQAYGTDDPNSPPLSPIQTPRSSFPKQSAFEETDPPSPRNESKPVDEFEAFETIEVAVERLSIHVIDPTLYEYLGNYINGHRIISDFKELLFLMHLQVMPIELKPEGDEAKKKKVEKKKPNAVKPINYDELRSLCSDNIQRFFRICSRFIERYNNIAIPKFQKKLGKKVFHLQLKAALEERNKAILKCIQDVCIAIRMYFMAVDERYFYNELSSRFNSVACLARDQKSIWARFAMSLPLIPDKESGDLKFPEKGFSITGCLSTGVAQVVQKSNVNGKSDHTRS